MKTTSLLLLIILMPWSLSAQQDTVLILGTPSYNVDYNNPPKEYRIFARDDHKSDRYLSHHVFTIALNKRQGIEFVHDHFNPDNPFFSKRELTHSDLMAIDTVPQIDTLKYTIIRPDSILKVAQSHEELFFGAVEQLADKKIFVADRNDFFMDQDGIKKMKLIEVEFFVPYSMPRSFHYNAPFIVVSPLLIDDFPNARSDSAIYIIGHSDKTYIDSLYDGKPHIFKRIDKEPDALVNRKSIFSIGFGMIFFHNNYNPDKMSQIRDFIPEEDDMQMYIRPVKELDLLSPVYDIDSILSKTNLNKTNYSDIYAWIINNIYFGKKYYIIDRNDFFTDTDGIQKMKIYEARMQKTGIFPRYEVEQIKKAPAKSQDENPIILDVYNKL